MFIYGVGIFALSWAGGIPSCDSGRLDGSAQAELLVLHFSALADNDGYGWQL
jgi:hypothetical protein